MVGSYLRRLFNAKAILVERHEWYSLTHSWVNEGDHIFLNGISSKVNAITCLELKFIFLEATAQHFSYSQQEEFFHFQIRCHDNKVENSILVFFPKTNNSFQKSDEAYRWAKHYIK